MLGLTLAGNSPPTEGTRQTVRRTSVEAAIVSSVLLRSDKLRATGALFMWYWGQEGLHTSATRVVSRGLS